jgi:MFS family permease
MGDEAREESLKISRPLVLTGGFQVFADQLYNRFIQLLAIAVGATVDQLGILNAVKSVASNILQVFFGRMADRFGKRRFIAAGRFLNGVIPCSHHLHRGPRVPYPIDCVMLNLRLHGITLME